MGSKKNKNNKRNNSHKHVYVRKKIPRRQQLDEEHSEEPRVERREEESQAERSEEQNDLSLEGSRIIDLDLLQQYSDSLAHHSSKCSGSILLNGESRFGLASVLTGQCTECQHSIQLATSKKVKGPKGYTRWESNLAAVWGKMSTGGGHTQLQEEMSVLGVPVMSKASFISTEFDIGEAWTAELQESMAEAGREEKRLAEERGDYYQGVPAITVIVDGGWSKRSHKHSYNANSGVGIIIGKATGKLLHLGVRNKYCSACARNIPRDKHRCFKNWDKSSSEMETDIILEGFLEAERVHGVRYMKFVGDGDSSVYPTLLQNVPGWGHAIKKIECANHACKCYRSALERLVQANPSYKGSGGLTLKTRKKLVSAARAAIRMRSREDDKRKALALLKRDLHNGPQHVFGFHDQCSPDFCKSAQEKLQQTPPSTSSLQQTSSSPSGSQQTPPSTSSLQQTSSSPSGSQQTPPSTSSLQQTSSSPSGSQQTPPSTSSFQQTSSSSRGLCSPPSSSALTPLQCPPTACSSTVPCSSAPSSSTSSQSTPSENDASSDLIDISSNQGTLWEDTLADDSATELEARRGGLTPTYMNPQLHHDIQVQLSRLIGKADQLIGNETTNLAESWMNIRAKFDGGKYKNRIQKGSFGYRCAGAGLRQNLGMEWGPQAWKEITQSLPNKVFTNTAERSAKIADKDRKRKATEEVKEKRRKSKYARTDNTTAARRAYSRHDGGVTPDEVIEDVSEDRLEDLKSSFYQTKVVITREEAQEIEQQTRDQADNEQWKYERRKRITASRAGGIAKMKNSTKRSSKVKDMLYSTFRGNVATRYGSDMEEGTRQQYIAYQQANGHPGTVVENCGLFISEFNNWLAATPDGIVHDPTDESHPLGLLEIKNPHSFKDKDFEEACQKSSFCLEKNENGVLQLKRRHDYYFQIQCQLYCVNKNWCDFVVRTTRDMHVERIFRESRWWGLQLAKLRKFYFSALLPELAYPRFRCGGIREPTNS